MQCSCAFLIWKSCLGYWCCLTLLHAPQSSLGQSFSFIVAVGCSPSLWAVYAMYLMCSMRLLWPWYSSMTWWVDLLIVDLLIFLVRNLSCPRRRGGFGSVMGCLGCLLGAMDDLGTLLTHRPYSLCWRASSVASGLLSTHFELRCALLIAPSFRHCLPSIWLPSPSLWWSQSLSTSLNAFSSPIWPPGSTSWHGMCVSTSHSLPLLLGGIPLCSVPSTTVPWSRMPSMSLNASWSSICPLLCLARVETNIDFERSKGQDSWRAFSRKQGCRGLPWRLLATIGCIGSLRSRIQRSAYSK